MNDDNSKANNSQKNKNYDKDENEEENESYFSIDEDRPCLLDIDRRFSEMQKKKNDEMMKKKRKRAKDKTDIVYDANERTLIDCFCPNLEELNKFLANCEIREIKNEDEIKKIKDISKKNIFDPQQFIKKNYHENEHKYILTFEDISLNDNKDNSGKKEYLQNEDKNPQEYIEIKNELIKDILNTKILNNKQKGELHKLISKIKI